MDTLNLDQRRRNMQAIKATATKPETLLAKSLWKKGYRYRKNVRTLVGKPDIVFANHKIAIFCDGEFWHGKDWDKKKQRLDQNREYWVKKIERNMQRDREVNAALNKDGWIVLRFWDKDIHRKLNKCLEIIEELILHKKRQSV